MEKGRLEAGCDEAGRGCLAGPVAAAAVILPNDFTDNRLNDSKALTKEARNELRIFIEQEALAYGVALIDHHTIDDMNILRASFHAMHRALDQLKAAPDFLLIDGNRFIPYKKIAFECVVKGDGKYQSIAAASILAKTYRDEYMEKLHEEYPHFNWLSNKGYPTRQHRAAIVQHGPSPYHRRSFRLYPTEQGSLF